MNFLEGHQEKLTSGMLPATKVDKTQLSNVVQREVSLELIKEC
jgi:hypothetical protein